MQTFLPYADFTASSVALDDRRLGKQRVETFQILRALTWPEYAWKNHPAVRMWRGFVPALVAYGLANCTEWVRRGNADTVEASLLTFTAGRRPDIEQLRRSGQLPPWVGLPALHLSHRSALLRKDPEFYRPLFGEIPDDLPYLWPPAAFPRWPARLAAGTTPGLAGGLNALGYTDPWPGQAEAVAAVTAGWDVLGCFAPRAGATSTALLAGLAVSGTTLWVSAHAGGGGELPPGGLVPPTPRMPAPVAAPAASSSAPAARPPSPVEVLAMAGEAEAVPDFRFHRPEELEQPDVRADLERTPLALIVVDLGPASAIEPADAHADPVRRLRAELAATGRAPPPLLVVGGAATQTGRRDRAERYGLTAPQLVGGGFDPVRLRLGVLIVPDETRRRAALASLLVRGPRPGLLLAPDVEAARRLAKGLADRGAAVAPLLPVGRRSSTDAAVAAWRRGALRALVLPADQPMPAERLGRKDATFVHVVGPVPDRRRLLDLLRAVPNRAASPAVLLLVTPAERAAAEAGEAGDPGFADLLSGRVCRRAALLDVVSEPVADPCGRCDVCLDVPAEELLMQPMDTALGDTALGETALGDTALNDAVSTAR
jgi:hypothetical protein